MDFSAAARYFPNASARRNSAREQGSAAIEELRTKDAFGQGAGAEISDELLMQQLQTGDLQALELLYLRYAKLVYSICLRVLKDSAEAEDLVHEVFLCFLRKCKLFDPEKGNVRSWLVQLTYHRCFDWRRYLKTRHALDKQSLSREQACTGQKSGPDPVEQIIWNPRMVAAFQRLSKEQQVSLRLYYLNGWTFQEIADRLRCPKGNVKNHVYRGLARLREIVFAVQIPAEPEEKMVLRKREPKEGRR